MESNEERDKTNEQNSNEHISCSQSTNSTWDNVKQIGNRILSKITNTFSLLTNLVRMEQYEYIPARDHSRLYIANEVPFELEPVFSYLTRGQNGFVIEDDEGEIRSLIINVDFWDYTKVMVVLMSVNTVALFLMLIVRAVCPAFYEGVRKQFVFWEMCLKY